ncbi:HD domain protein [Aquisphaera giovannonii]|uniref:HD domain protein n=1 Tax=Aquisphaera giovannonii TaxID=406548 RepID=A0A5B9W3T2_9BACT|nr:HD domain-containing protein [Aquisphaera giovannonii]QEH35276.1 HD domain protein [Aquisphaera giovannonii]
MSSKIIRDPLYNYISIDADEDGWLIELLDSPEVQRLRRIHQLGVSYLTYPGADHNRLAHSLGVLHLMQQAFQRLRQVHKGADINRGREPVLAAALVHDVGHGPFSHLFEPCLGIDHESWSRAVILDEETAVHRVLKRVDRSLPRTVADLIDADNQDHPAWQKYLLSSQLDMDRLDYLRRDSLFTGAGYGHFDWYRLLNTFEIYEAGDSGKDIVWAEKSQLAIEEFIYARFYMYHNVYLHKTTRGFEKLLEAMWGRARRLHDDGTEVLLVPAIRDFWGSASPSVRQYLAMEEFTVLQQIQNWTGHPDRSLGDLARRFLGRQRFAMVEAPDFRGALAPDYEGCKAALMELVGSRAEYDPPEMYCLEDRVKAKYNQPYFPEKEDDEQSVKNAIRILVEDSSTPIEVSKRLDRLKAVTEVPEEKVRYYVPKDLQEAARRLLAGWK